MLEKINLFLKREAIWEKRERLRRLAQVVSVVALILYFVFLSSLLSYYLLLSREKNTISREIGVLERRVKELEAVESKFVFLKSKLKDLLEIFKFEEKPETVFENLETLILSGISFSTIDYTDGNLKINGEARDAVVLDKFVKNLEDKGRSFFSQAEFESVNKTTEGAYNFNLLLIR